MAAACRPPDANSLTKSQLPVTSVPSPTVTVLEGGVVVDDLEEPRLLARRILIGDLTSREAFHEAAAQSTPTGSGYRCIDIPVFLGRGPQECDH